MLLFNYLQIVFNLLRTIFEEDGIQQEEIREIIRYFQAEKAWDSDSEGPSQ